MCLWSHELWWYSSCCHLPLGGGSSSLNKLVLAGFVSRLKQKSHGHVWDIFLKKNRRIEGRIERGQRCTAVMWQRRTCDSLLSHLCQIHTCTHVSAHASHSHCGADLSVLNHWQQSVLHNIVSIHVYPGTFHSPPTNVLFSWMYFQTLHNIYRFWECTDALAAWFAESLQTDAEVVEENKNRRD